MLTRTCRIVLASLFVAVVATTTRAQCLSWEPSSTSPPADGDRTFNSPTWFDDGTGLQLYLGVRQNWTNVPSVYRWNGTELAPVGSLAGPVTALAVFDDGSGPKLYAAGTLHVTWPNQLTVARWTGAAWETVASGGSSPVVETLVVHDDGSGPALYAGGRFRATPASPDIRLGRFDGNAWSTFGGAIDNTVFALCVIDEGQGPRLFVGGYFQNVGGQALRGLARWDGASFSAVGGGIDGLVWGLDDYTDAGGQGLLVSGSFTSVGGTSASNIALWKHGSWTVYPPIPEGASASTRVAAVDVGAGPRIYVHATPNTLIESRVRVWNGAAWEQVGSTLRRVSCLSDQYLSCQMLEALDLGAGPRLCISGAFSSVVGGASGKFVCFDGTDWQRALPGPQGIEPNAAVRALASFDDGTGPALWVGGRFCRIDGITAINVARRQAGVWEGQEIREVAGNGNDRVVTAFGVYDLGAGPSLFAGGHIVVSVPQNCTGIARWNGTDWESVGTGLNGAGLAVLAIAGATIGGVPRIYAGGRFHYAGSVASPNVAAWNGTSWEALPPGPTAGVNGDVRALAACNFGAGEQLFVGGSFTMTEGDVLVNRIARWNGTSMQAIGSGMNGDVWALCAFDDGSGPRLYAAGNFTLANGVPANRVARFDGTSWSPVGAGFDLLVKQLTVFDDGSGPRLYAAGDFNWSGGTPTTHVAMWDGSAWRALGNGLGPDVRAMVVHRDDPASPQKLWFGGALQTVGTLATSNLAAWSGCEGAIQAFCFADGTSSPCPCGNSGASGNGCNNSWATGGARLDAWGTATPDTITLAVAGELPDAATLVFQGDAQLVSPLPFGDGLRCVGGTLLRLYTRNAVGGALTVPGPGDLPISHRAAQLGDVLTPGAIRSYQTWYRDPDPGFCLATATWNLSNAVRVVW